MNDKDTPVVIDAEYSIEERKTHLEEAGGGFYVPKRRRDISLKNDGDMSLPGGITLKAKDKKTIQKLITSVVKSVFYFLIWSVRQFGSLIVAGVSGTVEGVKQASDRDSRDDDHDYRRDSRRSYQRKRDVIEKKPSRPIWYIPTREEEEAERRMRY
jgi:hypothetical protein